MVPSPVDAAVSLAGLSGPAPRVEIQKPDHVRLSEEAETDSVCAMIGGPRKLGPTYTVKVLDPCLDVEPVVVQASASLTATIVNATVNVAPTFRGTLLWSPRESNFGDFSRMANESELFIAVTCTGSSLVKFSIDESADVYSVSGVMQGLRQRFGELPVNILMSRSGGGDLEFDSIQFDALGSVYLWHKDSPNYGGMINDFPNQPDHLRLVDIAAPIADLAWLEAEFDGHGLGKSGIDF